MHLKPWPRLYSGTVTRNPTWTSRLQAISQILHIASFLVATGGVVFVLGLTTETVVATALAALGMLLGLALPIPFADSPWRATAQIGGSIALYAVAIGLTGGVVSTFTLLPIATIFLAASGGGLRYAAPTAITAIIALVVIGLLDGSAADRPNLIVVPALYAITALAFAEIRGAVTTESARAQNLLVASDAAATRISRLEATHDLLADLAKVAQSSDINAVTTAQNAVRDVGLILPDTPSRVVTDDGTVLARRGNAPDEPPSMRLPVVCSGNEVAHLDLWIGSDDLEGPQRTAITRAITPVGLAIDNDVLLQQVAGITIQRERARLARELHDDVAPSIAAVGLALDMALMSGDLNEDHERNLSATRSNVSRLVEQVRLRVQDLRADRTLSVLEMAHSLVAEVDVDGPTVVVNIDERAVPRPAIAAELGAFLTEAFRNAIEHAEASAIWITGRVTDHDGFLAIQDNGTGFDSTASNDRRFGLVGMEERAAMIPATFELETEPGTGTVVSLTWKG